MALGRLALALIGILAYQNRDKLGALLRGENRTASGAGRETQEQTGGIFDDIADKFGAGDALRQVLDRFQKCGQRRHRGFLGQARTQSANPASTK